jgi:hypothetical protein
MEQRYAVILNGKKIGTVRLDPARRGRVRARLAPLPAFRSIARHRRVLASAQDLELREGDLSPADLAALDGAEAVLESLTLSLVQDPEGTPIITRRLELLKGDPPFLQITW